MLWVKKTGERSGDTVFWGRACLRVTKTSRVYFFPFSLLSHIHDISLLIYSFFMIYSKS